MLTSRREWLQFTEACLSLKQLFCFCVCVLFFVFSVLLLLFFLIKRPLFILLLFFFFFKLNVSSLFYFVPYSVLDNILEDFYFRYCVQGWIYKPLEHLGLYTVIDGLS